MKKTIRRCMAVLLAIALVATSAVYSANTNLKATSEELEAQTEQQSDGADVSQGQVESEPPVEPQEILVEKPAEEEPAQVESTPEEPTQENASAEEEPTEEESAQEYRVVFHKPVLEGGTATTWAEGQESASVVYDANKVCTVTYTAGTLLNYAITTNENFEIDKITKQDGAVIGATSIEGNTAYYKIEVNGDIDITTVYKKVLSADESQSVENSNDQEENTEEIETAEEKETVEETETSEETAQEYELTIEHILNTEIGKFRQENQLQITEADFVNGEYDVLQNAVEKEGITLSTEVLNLTEEQFEEKNSLTVTVEYEVAPGWHAENKSQKTSRASTQGTFDDVTIEKKLNAIITYKPEYDFAGAVSVTSEELLKKYSYRPQGSTASAKGGYAFAGWFEEKSGEFISTRLAPNADEILKFVAKGDYNVDTTLVASFKTIIYYDTNIENKPFYMMGTILTKSEKVDMVNGNAGGSIATPKEGYLFEGWYYNGEQITKNPKLDGETIKQYLENEQGVLQSGRFEARFAEQIEARIYYQSSPYWYGTTTPTEEMDVKQQSGGIILGSTAKANPGYEFIDWYIMEREENSFKDISLTKEKYITPEIVNQHARKDDGAGEYYEETIFFAYFDELPAVTLTYEASGGGSVSKKSEAVMPATGKAEGSTATIPEKGYVFEGWYVVTENGKTLVTTNLKLSRSDIDTYAKTEEKIYQATSFVAEFKEQENVTISYLVKGDGTVSKDKESVAPVTGNPSGSIATPMEDSIFHGWYYVEGDKHSFITMEQELTTGQIRAHAYKDGLYVDSSFVAEFLSDEKKTIQYEIVGASTQATLSNASEVVRESTGNPEGSIVNAINEGYEFKGWYTDATYSEASKVTESPNLTRELIDQMAKSQDGLYTDYTFYALIEAKTNAEYTVHYYKLGTTESLAADKKVSNLTFDEEFREEAIDILGYTVEEASKVVTAGYENNEITFFYSANAQEYTVNYINSATNLPLKDAEVKSAFYDDTIEVEEEYVEILGYEIDSYDPETEVVIGADNSENVINVYYKATAQTYTVTYINRATGEEILESETKDTFFNETITSRSEYVEIPGYVTDGFNPETELTIGTDNNENVITVYYVASEYAYTVNYYLSGTDEKLEASIDKQALFNNQITGQDERISIEGHTFESVDPETLTIKTEKEENVINVYYTRNRHNVVIDYTTPDGETTIPNINDEYEFGDSFEYVTPTIPGYTATVDVIEGTVGDEDVRYEIEYIPNEYTLTINYVDDAGNIMAPTYSQAHAYKSEIDAIVSPEVDGYTRNYNSIRVALDDKMPASNLEFTVTYTAIPATTPTDTTTPTDATTPGAPVTPAAATDTLVTIAPTPTPAADVVATLDEDGDYTLTPVEDTETPLANTNLEDTTCCILHFLIMLLALLVLILYTRSMKKKQEELFALEEEVELKVTKKSIEPKMEDVQE